MNLIGLNFDLVDVFRKCLHQNLNIHVWRQESNLDLQTHRSILFSLSNDAVFSQFHLLFLQNR